MRLLPGHPTSRNHPAPLAALALRQKLEAVGRAVRERAVDAVLFLDRLDSYKVDTLDRKVGTCSCLVVRWRCAGTALGGGVCSTGGIHGCLWGVRCGRCYPHHDTHQRINAPMGPGRRWLRASPACWAPVSGTMWCLASPVHPSPARRQVRSCKHAASLGAWPGFQSGMPPGVGSVGWAKAIVLQAARGDILEAWWRWAGWCGAPLHF